MRRLMRSDPEAGRFLPWFASHSKKAGDQPKQIEVVTLANGQVFDHALLAGFGRDNIRTIAVDGEEFDGCTRKTSLLAAPAPMMPMCTIQPVEGLGFASTSAVWRSRNERSASLNGGCLAARMAMAAKPGARSRMRQP